MVKEYLNVHGELDVDFLSHFLPSRIMWEITTTITPSQNAVKDIFIWVAIMDGLFLLYQLIL